MVGASLPITCIDALMLFLSSQERLWPWGRNDRQLRSSAEVASLPRKIASPISHS